MSPQKQRSTFISYSRINKEFAVKLALELRSMGFDIWLDQLDIPPGARWDDEVEMALEKSEIFMVILTSASMASSNVKDEISYAIDNRKRILPILLENASIPLRLRRFQYVDFTSKSFDEGVEAAMQLLKRLIDEPTLPNLEIPPAFRTQDAGATQKAQEQKEQPAAQKGEADRKSKEEAGRLAMQRAEEERVRKAEMEAQRKAGEKAEKERLALEKAQADRIAQEKKEAERLAAQKAKEERKAREEAERIAKQRAKIEQPVPQKADVGSAPAGKNPRLPLMIGAAGAGALIVLAIIIVAVVNMSNPEIPNTGESELASPSPEPIQVQAQPTNTPRPTPIPPSPTPEAQQFFTETFQGEYEDHWRPFLRSGDVEKFTLTREGDGLLFDLNDQGIFAYLVYEAFEYEEVRVDATVENIGVNDNNVTLFCRYSPEQGWYEFNFYSSGLYDMYFTKPDSAGNLNYGLIAEGGSNEIKTGKATNTYTIICKKDALIIFINDVETRTVNIPTYVLENGMVGVSASSFGSIPVQVKFKQVKISEP